MQSPPSSVLVSINGFDIHYYGLIMFCAIAAGIFVMRTIAKKFYKDVDTEIIVDILPVIILSSILGARLYYVFMDWPYFSRHAPEILALWHGGMSIHGGILGGVISGLIYSKIKNYEVIYEAGTIFSRSNNTSQTIDFQYNTSSSTTKEIDFNLSGTLAMKASGKIDSISASLDRSIRSDIGFRNNVTFEEEMDFQLQIPPRKKISLIVKGRATLSSGAHKYYFLGICLNKGYWEYVDIINEYYELYEEEIY